MRVYKQTPYAIKKYVNNFFYCLSRYATTLVTSEVHNPETRSREIFMTVILPDTAFISRFAIELGGQLFVAYVREKENAWREYQEAVSKGKTAGKYEQILQLCSWVHYPKEKFWASMYLFLKLQFLSTRTCWNFCKTF